MKNCLSIVTILLTVFMFSTGCSKKNEAVNIENKPVTVLKGVALETVKSSSTSELLDIVGTVRAQTSAIVSTRIPGTVKLLRVKEGDRVKKGQLLVQLEAEENQATAAVANAATDEALRGLDEALSRKKLADSTFERYNNLLKEQAISRQEFDVKRTEKEVAAQTVSRAEARLRLSQASAKAATTVSDYTRILAPISGMISVKSVDLGTTVFPGQPLMKIEDEGSYLLELAIPENVVSKVKIGSSLKVTLDSLGVSFDAKVSEILPIADSGSRTFIARIALNQKGLKSGMFGRGSINLGTTVNRITIPKKALIERGALQIVWALDSEKNVHMRIVKIGRESGERVEITAGLVDGDLIVVTGGEKVTEGARVE